MLPTLSFLISSSRARIRASVGLGTMPGEETFKPIACSVAEGACISSCGCACGCTMMSGTPIGRPIAWSVGAVA